MALYTKPARVFGQARATRLPYSHGGKELAQAHRKLKSYRLRCQSSPILTLRTPRTRQKLKNTSWGYFLSPHTMVWGLGELPYRSPYPRSTYSTEGEALGLLPRMFKIASPSAFSYIHPKRVLSGPRRRVQPPGRIGTIPGAPDISIKQRTRSNG